MRNFVVQNGYILNIDILGFGTFVKNNSAQTVFDHYAGLITGADFAGAIVDDGNIEVMVYSDTIAIKSNAANEDNGFVDLVRIANILQTGQYYRYLSLNGAFLPLRGTIAYGEFFFHKGDIWTQAHGRQKTYAKNVAMIIGKPIVESYETEKEMELMCVALTKSTLEMVNEGFISAMLDSNLLLEYQIPLKNGNSNPGVIVNPVSTPHFEINLRQLKLESTKYAEGSSTQRKYLNTIKLFEHVQGSRRFYPKKPE